MQHPLIRADSIEEREYQHALADTCLKGSTLVVLPTGMGKTVVALLVIAEVLRKAGRKVLLMAPTKPLVEQHKMFLDEFLVDRSVISLNGTIPPEEREALWIEHDVVVSTPQVMANDLRNGRISLDRTGLVIFDEAHRAIGSYAYVKVAEAYRDYGGLSLGMTASPGSDPAKVLEVCSNLDIERIEVRTETDPDVSPYVHDIRVNWVEVELPGQMKSIIGLIKQLHESLLEELKTLGVLGRWGTSTKALLQLGRHLQERLRRGERSRAIYRALSVQAMAMKVSHALALAETQGATALSKYLDRLREEADSEGGTKASKELIKRPEMVQVRQMLRNARMEHPKLSRVMSIVSNQVLAHPDSRVLVFTHYRDTCDLVAEKLSRIDGARVGKLVGQAGERGLKQKEQVGVLKRFREGEYNVVVATSVGEEGLDVASTDLVVFYEPVPSEVRTIQRRGRTGRSRGGRVVVLITKGTRDEAYHFSSKAKEERMKKRLLTLNEELGAPRERTEDQSSLLDFR